MTTPKFTAPIFSALLLALALSSVPALAASPNENAPAQTESASDTPSSDTASAPAHLVHLTAADADRLFRDASDACLHDRLDECVTGYERLLGAGFAGVDLYFNLGTALLRQNKLGPAILYLERAQREAPDDSEVAANLSQAQKLRLDKLVDAPEAAQGGSAPLSSRIAQSTQRDLWTIAFLVLWLLGASLALARRLFSGSARVLCALVATVLVVLSLPAGAVLLSHAYVERHAQEAIVLSPALPVREGPSPQFKVAFEIHEGLKVQLVEREAAFQRVRLLNGLQGWVPAQGLAKIDGDAPLP